jgi:sec-independent protein translocase protein TatA
MSIGFWQILLVVALVVLLFGRGKISDLMGDVAKGIKSFKKGMAEDETDEHRTIDHDATEPMTAKSAEEKTKAS